MSELPRERFWGPAGLNKDTDGWLTALAVHPSQPSVGKHSRGFPLVLSSGGLAVGEQRKPLTHYSGDRIYDLIGIR